MGLYRFSPFEFDSGTGRLAKHGLRVKLQQKPQIVLTALLEGFGKTVTRQELYQRLWPEGVHVDFDQGLSVAVKKLRYALGDATDTPRYIVTVAGTGYRFVGAVEEVHKQAAIAPAGVRGAVEAEPPSEFPRLTSVLMGGARSNHRAAAAVGACLVVLLGLLFVFARSLPQIHVSGTRSSIAPPAGWQLLTTQDIGGAIALSPDGTEAVFAARHAKLGPMLLLHHMDSLSAEPIPGTENATMPFWAPDGKRIGFFADHKLKTIDLASGAVQDICEVPESPRGGTWGVDNSILFAASTRGPIVRVSAGGGTPTPVTDLDGSRYTTHRWPVFLPDGRHFLFFAANHGPDETARPAIFLGSLDGHSPQFVVESDSNALFVADELLFVAGGKLFAQSFQAETGKVGSAAKVLADNIEYDPSLWHAAFSATPELLVFRQRAEAPETQVISFLDQSGKLVRTASRPGFFRGASPSPDGTRVAAMCDAPGTNICVIQPDGNSTRVSAAPINSSPIWSPDGAYLVYGTHRGSGRQGLVLKDANGQQPEQELSASPVYASSWTPDQKTLLVERPDARGKTELATLRLADRRLITFVSGNFNVNLGQSSPDGKWVAYESDETGRQEIYVTSYPEPRVKTRVSETGGHVPRWGGSSQELYFLDPSDTIHRVKLAKSGKGLKVESAESLFRPVILPPPYDSDSFGIVPQLNQFVVVGDASPNDSPYVLVTSWRN